MSNQFKQYDTKQLAEKVQDAFINEDEEEIVIEFLESTERYPLEEIMAAKDDWGLIEYLAIDSINWLGKDELIDFINEHGLEIE